MKKIFKTTMALALALAMVLSCNVAAFAAEVPATETDEAVEVTPVAVSEDYDVAPCYNDYEYGIVVKTSWKTIATSTTGFNCNVDITSKNAAISTTDIRMLDKNGNVVWSENSAIAFNSSRIFWCGSNVYTIQARVSTGMTNIYCYETTNPAD